MDHIKVGVHSAVSHSWHKHSDSWLVVRAIKTFANGIKAWFGGYFINILDKITPRLMQKHPNALFARQLQKPLSAFNLSIPSACKDSSSYVFDKVKNLDETGRKLEVKLACKPDGSVAAIPMYYSTDVDFPVNFNCKVSRSESDTKAPGKEINCRHFSWAYANKVFGRRKAPFAKINTPEKIRSTFADISDIPVVDAYSNSDGSSTINQTKSLFADGYYFPQEKFSEALGMLVNKYWKIPDGEEKNFLFDRKVHSMALRLKKQKDCMKVIFYEPNDTLRHRTCLLSEPGLANHITTEDLQSFPFRDACLANISDRVTSVDQCDIQCIGITPSELSTPPMPRHEDHEIFRRRVRGVGR